MHSEQVRERLEDIEYNIALIRRFTAGFTFHEFAASELVFYATTRALEIVSEASRHLPDALKSAHPEIDWIGVRDAGNIYRHAYEQVNEHRVWDTVQNHLGGLDAVVRAELAGSPSDRSGS